LDSIPEYIQELKKYNAGIEEIIDRGEEEVLKLLKISKQQWEQSYGYYMARNDQQIMILQMTLPSKIT
jgi:hypothetical protein